jgi:putative ABC transport system permease protein
MLVARLAPERIRPAMQHLEGLVARYAPGEPFEYEFLDDAFDAMYRTEQRLGQVFTSFAVLAIFVACLGLFGLAAYTAEVRTKEIGIRKVMGASVTSIVRLLSKDFVVLVALAFVVAAPVAYYAMNRWLADFAYRIDIRAGEFVVVGLVALAVALATVGYQAVRAALADPVKALRYE